VAEQPPYFMEENTPTAGEIDIARGVLAERIGASPWRRLDTASEVADKYRTACAIVADQSEGLERMLDPDFNSSVDIGKAAPRTPARDGVRKLLLGSWSPEQMEIWRGRFASIRIATWWNSAGPPLSGGWPCVSSVSIRRNGARRRWLLSR
jgi:hypothetical protein